VLAFALTREGLDFLLHHVVTSYSVVILLLYVISPFDLLPESVFGFIGILDDFFVLFLLMVYLSQIYYNFVAEREQNLFSAQQSRDRDHQARASHAISE